MPISDPTPPNLHPTAPKPPNLHPTDPKPHNPPPLTPNLPPFPAGSDQERSAVSTATSHGSRPRARGPTSMGELTLTLGSGPAVAGTELELWVKVHNSGSESRSLRFRLSLCALRYTGVSAPPFRQEQHRRVVEAGGGEGGPRPPWTHMDPH